MIGLQQVLVLMHEERWERKQVATVKRDTGVKLLQPAGVNAGWPAERLGPGRAPAVAE